jgi:hypothetical protein
LSINNECPVGHGFATNLEDVLSLKALTVLNYGKMKTAKVHSNL